jgi:taurine dioxygenase
VTFEHPVFFEPPHLEGRAVIASEQMTAAVVDLPPEESDAFLSELYAYMYARDNVYEHRWKQGDVVIWDNIALHHSRPGETGTESRHLRRQCIDGWYTPEGDLLDWSLTRRTLRTPSER